MVAMKYLQVDASQSVLHVLPALREWDDYRDDKHFEYHVATLRMFNGQPFTVEIDAKAVPWSALLHIHLLARVARHARATHKNQLIKVNVVGASSVTRAMHTLLSPLAPKTVLEKIHFVDAARAVKKLT